MKLLTLISRILVGSLFIFSGLIKANDPYGFAYKLDEYFGIFHMDFFIPYTVGMSIIICVLEVFMGFWLLIGYKAALNAWSLLILIIFFDFLTGYTALANLAKANPSWGFSQGMASLMGAVDAKGVAKPEYINALSDCGCFGDFIKLKPYQSFWKDVVLTILIVIIFIRRKYIIPAFNPSLSAIGSFTVGFVAIAFPVICYLTLPYKDFLPYKEGNDIVEFMKPTPGAPTDSVVMMFIYKNKAGGEPKEFDMNHLPDSNWEYLDRKDKLVREGEHPPIHDFNLFDAEGNEFTDLITEQEGFKMVYMMKDLGKQSPSKLIAIGKLAAGLRAKNPNMMQIGVTNDINAAKAVEAKYKLGITMYSLDGTVIKTMVRSNLGFLLFNKSTVVRKWSAFTMPTADIVLGYVNNGGKKPGKAKE